MKTTPAFLLGTALLLLAGQGAVNHALGQDEQRLWVGLFPKAALDALPPEQRHEEIGYIGDPKRFAMVWQHFRPTGKAGTEMPKVDFNKQIVLFVRDTDFRNEIRDVSVASKQGEAFVNVTTRRTALADDQVYMAFKILRRQDARVIKYRVKPGGEEGLKVINVKAP